MRSLFLLFASCIIAINLSAQISIAPEIGVNLSTYSTNTYGDKNLTKLNGNIRAGLKADISLNDHFYLQPAVLYARNGFYPGNGAPPYGITMNINTIEIPLQLVYKINKPGPGTPFFGIGPYIGFNAWGSTSYLPLVYPPGFYIMPLESPITRSLRIGSSSNDDIKLLDAGIIASAGIQLPFHIYTLLYFQKGFVNLQPSGDSNNYMKSLNMGMSLGYFFHFKHPSKK